MNTLLRCATQVLIVICLLASRTAWAQTDGSLDTSFDPGSGFDFDIHSLVLQADGKVIAGGDFNTFNTAPRNRIARLNADGSLDASFNPGSGFDNSIFSLVLQPDGKIVVGGDFTTFNGTACGHIARLNANGSLDGSFDPGLGFNDAVLTMVLQQDGKLIAGGSFSSINGTARNQIARLNTNGSLDVSFDPGSGFDNAVESVALQSDGKIIAGGMFTTFNSTAQGGIARLNANGSLDAVFNTSNGFAGGLFSIVYSLVLQPDGKIIAGGSFTSFSGFARNYVARLNTNGSLDFGFDPGSGFTDIIKTLTLQPNGKLLAGGGFFSFNGTARSKIARLNVDGLLDVTFDPNDGFDGVVESLALQPDGKLIAGGAFQTFDGAVRNHITRLNVVTANVKSVDYTFLSLSPNPARHTATLSTTQPVHSVRLTNTAGRVALTQPGGTGAISLDVSTLSPGLYLLEAEMQAGQTLRRRLVVE